MACVDFSRLRIAAAIGLMALVTVPAPAEVVAYWPFEAGSGMLAFDHAPAGNDALLRGAEWARGRVDGGMHFAGRDSDQYLVIGHDEALQLQAPFTIQFHWRPEDHGVRILFRKAKSRDRFTVYSYATQKLIRFIVVDAGGKKHMAECDNPGGGSWHHFAFRCGDGAHVTTETAADSLYTDASPLLIGTYRPGYEHSLAGTIDDLCISNALLAPDELEAELERARALEAPVVRAQDFDAPTGGIVLAKDGVPGASIVIAQDASSLQMEPALELRRYIAEMTGARLPLASDADAPEGNLVLVGASALTREMDLPDDLSGDEYIIRASPRRLVLLGHDALFQDDPSNADKPKRSKPGTSNAVFTFLRDHCGARFYMPGRLGEVLPEHQAMEVPAMELRGRPCRAYSNGAFTRRHSAWRRRHLLGTTVFISHHGGHLWHRLIPRKEYFDEHPEWFALRGGKRNGERNHLCVTNPEMRREALRNLRALFDEGYEWVQLGQTDGWKRCRCPECEALDDYRQPVGWWVPGVPADRIHLFHAWLTRQVAKSHPDRTVLNIAYGPTAEVPEKVAGFGDNVVIEFTQKPPSLVGRWMDYHDRFTAYVYWWGLYHRVGFGPKSTPRYVASEIRRMVDAGAEAFFLCGGGECWSTEAPAYYVYSRMQRDPTLDEEALVDEFCEGLFGEAAGTMRAYFDTFFEAAERYREMGHKEVVEGEPYRGERRPTSEWYLHCYPDEWFERCEQLLDRANAEAQSDAVRRRIAYFRDGFEYIRVTTECYHTLVAWQQEKTEAKLAAHRTAVEAREAFVDAMLQRDAARGGDLPPCFSLGRKWLLTGPRDRYADLYRPLE